MTRIRAAFIALIIASVALAAYGDRIGGNGPEFMPRDPGAARQNLSNVDAATGRSALGLGAMATEASTDYVATDTFTGHTGDASDPHGATLTQTTIISDSVDGVDVSAHVTDNSDVHGCTAIASASAVADALSAANASDALLLRLDGSRYSTGFQRWNGNYGVAQSTIDGADTGSLLGSGGGYTSGNLYDRAAAWILYGNEYSTIGGQARYYAGNVSTGDHIFYTGNGAERGRITYGGDWKINFTSTPSTDDSSVYFGDAVSFAAANQITYPIQTQMEQDGSTFYIQSNLYYNDGFKCFDTGKAAAAMRFICSGNDSHITFYTSAVNNTSPSERVRITKDGNVLIGTTTDDGSNKLQVSGSVAISSFAQLASPTAIPTAAKGRIYFNGSESKFKKCTDGSNWVDM